MENQGMLVGMTFIIGFIILAGLSIYFVATGQTDVDTLTAAYSGLGQLASVLGVPVILGVWYGTRGQTSE